MPRRDARPRSYPVAGESPKHSAIRGSLPDTGTVVQEAAMFNGDAYYGPTRLFVWLALLVAVWLAAAIQPARAWRRFVQEARIAYGIHDAGFVGWLETRRQLKYPELPVERWMRRMGRIA